MDNKLEKCKERFKKAYPKLTITDTLDLDQASYVFTAVENPKHSDYSDPFYKIDKITGKISPYSPINDLDRYVNAKQRQKPSK